MWKSMVLSENDLLFYQGSNVEETNPDVKRMWRLFQFQLSVENFVGKVENLFKSYRL